MGVREQNHLPEIDYDKVDRVRGLDITHPLLNKNLKRRTKNAW